MLPELLERLDAPEPILLGHSDGASIALIDASRHPVAGIALLAPHVFVEEVTLAAIRATRHASGASFGRRRSASTGLIGTTHV